MELHLHRISPVHRVHRAPGPGALRHRRLLVVDPCRGRNPAQAFKAGRMAMNPRQHLPVQRPHNRFLPAPGEHHVQCYQIYHLPAQKHPRKMRPIHLNLRSRRRLHPTTRTGLRRRICPLPITLHRTQAAFVTVLPHKPVVQQGQVRSPSPSCCERQCAIATVCPDAALRSRQRPSDAPEVQRFSWHLTVLSETPRRRDTSLFAQSRFRNSFIATRASFVRRAIDPYR